MHDSCLIKSKYLAKNLEFLIKKVFGFSFRREQKKLFSMLFHSFQIVGCIFGSCFFASRENGKKGPGMGRGIGWLLSRIFCRDSRVRSCLQRPMCCIQTTPRTRNRRGTGTAMCRPGERSGRKGSGSFQVSEDVRAVLRSGKCAGLFLEIADGNRLGDWGLNRFEPDSLV